MKPIRHITGGRLLLRTHLESFTMDRMSALPDLTHEILAVTNLTKLSLKNVSFALAAGERVAVTGRTGEGKSVLLRSLLGFLRPDSGSVTLLGRQVRGSPLSIEGLGVAFQSPGLFDTWSVGENLRIASVSQLSDDEIGHLLSSVGLDQLSPESGVTQLSGGQQKRLSLLRALIRGTQLLVLDEPTSGLDPVTSTRIAKMLRAAWDRHPRAMLIVTHDFEFALQVCDRILALSHGQLVDVTPVAGPSEERTAALRHSLSNDAVTPLPTRRRPFRWGTVALTMDFLMLGLPLAIVAMALLGAMLVAQSAGVGPIDVSRFIPGAIVLAVFREMAPLVVGLLLASRIGARVAAELAGMSYTAQIDSMRVLGLSPARRLMRPFLISSAISFPVTIATGALSAIVAAALYAGAPASRLSIGTRRFCDLASAQFDAYLPLSLLLKGITMAATVVLASCWWGTREVRSAQALGRAVTRAAVLASVSVILVDVIWSWIFFG